MRKDTRDRNDTRGTKHTYYNGSFLILLLLNEDQGRSVGWGTSAQAPP